MSTGSSRVRDQHGHMLPAMPADWVAPGLADCVACRFITAICPRCARFRAIGVLVHAGKIAHRADLRLIPAFLRDLDAIAMILITGQIQRHQAWRAGHLAAREERR